MSPLVPGLNGATSPLVPGLNGAMEKFIESCQKDSFLLAITGGFYE